MKIRALISFYECLSHACFSLPVAFDTSENLYKSNHKNLNKNFDDDINEIEKSRNFYLSIHLGINTYTSEARFTQSKQYMAGHLVWL